MIVPKRLIAAALTIAILVLSPLLSAQPFAAHAAGPSPRRIFGQTPDVVALSRLRHLSILFRVIQATR